MMPYGNANQIVKEMAYEILPVVERTPVLAGVCGTDPFMMPKLFLAELRELGFAGIQNFPTVGLFEGHIRSTLEETGMSYQLEVDITALSPWSPVSSRTPRRAAALKSSLRKMGWMTGRHNPSCLGSGFTSRYWGTAFSHRKTKTFTS